MDSRMPLRGALLRVSWRPKHWRNAHKVSKNRCGELSVFVLDRLVFVTFVRTSPMDLFAWSCLATRRRTESLQCLIFLDSAWQARENNCLCKCCRNSAESWRLHASNRLDSLRRNRLILLVLLLVGLYGISKIPFISGKTSLSLSDSIFLRWKQSQ